MYILFIHPRALRDGEYKNIDQNKSFPVPLPGWLFEMTLKFTFCIILQNALMNMEEVLCLNHYLK